MDLNKIKGELHSGTFHGVLKVIKEHSGTPLFFVHDRNEFANIDFELDPEFHDSIHVIFRTRWVREFSDLPTYDEFMEKFNDYAENGIYSGIRGWEPHYNEIGEHDTIIISYYDEYYYPVFEKTVDGSPLFRLYPLGRSIDE